MGAAQAQMGLVTAAFREGWQMGMQFNSIMKTDMSEWEELTATMGARAKVAISEIADTFVALWRLQIEVMTPGAGYVDRVKQAYAELKGELKENITNLSDLAAAVARAEAAHKAAEEALKKNTDGTKANTDATKANTDATKANSDEAKANAEEKERAKKAADELAAAQDKLRKAQDALKDGTEQATKKEQELNEEKQKAIDQSRERIAGMREELDLLNEQITSGTTVVGSLGDQFDKWADLTGAIQREKFALEERQEVAFHGAESDAASAKLASDARMAHIEMVNQETRAIADAASKTTDLYKIVETTAGHYTNFTHEVRESTDRFRDWDEAASASTETARKAAEVIRELKDSADGAKRDIVAMGEELRRLNEEAGRTITTMRDLSAATTAAGEAAAKAAG
jgi:methyl-accepting chemotaxis protein